MTIFQNYKLVRRLLLKFNINLLMISIYIINQNFIIVKTMALILVMIYYANKYISVIKNTENLTFEYLIIDEYQDISEDRYILAKQVSDKNAAKVVAVGDDWQTIFSFAGSKIEYIYNFSIYFPTANVENIKSLS